MNVEEALQFVEVRLTHQGKHLSDLQRTVFREAWHGKSYKEIHKACEHRIGLEHLMRNVGPDLWHLITAAIGKSVTKQNLQGPLEQCWREQQQVEGMVEQNGDPSLGSLMGQHNGDRPHQATRTEPLSTQLAPDALGDGDRHLAETNARQDWGGAPDVSVFHGRTQERLQLEQWLTLDGCRLVGLLGMGGIGKTDLAIKVAQQVRQQFACLIWRSLDHAPLLPDLLRDLNQSLSHQQDNSADRSRLLHYLTHQPCLIILDGWEAVLHPGVHDGSYRVGYEGYGDLLRQVGRLSHQSCIIITSREKPKEIAMLEGTTHRVRSLKLEGLGNLAGQELCAAKGIVSPVESDWRTLTEHRYSGNPFALNVVATRIFELCNGNISQYLKHTEQDTTIFGAIQTLLEQQWQRLSTLERSLLTCLTNHREPVTTRVLREQITPPVNAIQLQEALEALLRRSLIETHGSGYLVHPLMAEYVSDRRVEANA